MQARRVLGPGSSSARAPRRRARRRRTAESRRPACCARRPRASPAATSTARSACSGACSGRTPPRPAGSSPWSGCCDQGRAAGASCRRWTPSWPTTPAASGVRYLKLRVLADARLARGRARRGRARGSAPSPATEATYREVGAHLRDGLRRRARAGRASRAAGTRCRPPTPSPWRSATSSRPRGDGTAPWRSGRRRLPARTWTRARSPGASQELPDGRDGGRASPGGRASDARTIRAAAHGAAGIALDLGLEAEALALRAGRRGRTGGPRPGARSSRMWPAAPGDAGWATWRPGPTASWAQDAESPRGAPPVRPAPRRGCRSRGGDTATALEAQRRVVASFTPGSVDRRQATARALSELEAGRAAPERLRTLLADFRAEFPEAPELDELSATVAGGAPGPGRRPRAPTRSWRGSRAAQRAAARIPPPGGRGGGRGARGAADGAARAAARRGHGTSSSSPGLLGRLSPAVGPARGRGGRGAHEGRGDEAASRSPTRGEAPRGGAAAAAGRGGPHGRRAGADGRRSCDARLLEKYPDAPEAAEASLALARYPARPAPAGGTRRSASSRSCDAHARTPRWRPTRAGSWSGSGGRGREASACCAGSSWWG